MPHHGKQSVEGEITEAFSHRTVVRAADGSMLAGLGPKLVGRAAPEVGGTVEPTGDRKPSEREGATFERGGEVIGAGHHDDGRAPADPEAALDAVKAEGHTVVAEPRRRPKPFEGLARDRGGRHHEHRVRLDGGVRRSKDGDPTGARWKALASPAA